MDPVTITTAAAKIVNTTLQVVQTCNEYYQKYQAVDLQLVCMQTQCSIIEVALLQIQDVIMHDSARFERLRSVSVLASNYERTLGACQIVFAILKERLNKLNSHLRGNCGKQDWQLKLKVVWNDQESAMLLKNIEGQASAISLLLNAIQMKTQVEMLGLLTKKESKSILKTASDDADTLSLVHENNAGIGLPDGESVITSKLDDTEFDFDFEIINTAAYRKVFNKARSKLPSKTGSQAVIPPHTPTSSGAGASETTTLRSINTPAAIHTVVASHENNFSSRPNDSSRDVGSCSVLSKVSSEGACDGSSGVREKQHDVGLEDQLPSIPKRGELLLSGYTIATSIGTGQKGEVKLAWKKDPNLPVAVKFMKREPTASGTNHTRKICHDLAILRGLSHPNIIRLHEMLDAGSDLAVVQEYIPGGSLAKYVAKRTRLSDHFSQRVFAQIISGVGYLHRNGIVHLGLSLSKALLDRNQNVVLTGFSNMKTFDPEDTYIDSLSKNVEDLELFAKYHGLDRRDERGFMRGDLMKHRLEASWYTAPEASLYRLYEGRKADVWSCGIILYMMLAGHIPSLTLIFPEYCPPLARDLVNRMVDKRPQHRANLGEVAHHSWLSDYAHVVSDVN